MLLCNKVPYLTAVDTECTDDGAGLIEGDPEVLDSAGVYGKPTHAQHVYLPYFEGQMLFTRKCVPSVCLRSFQSRFHDNYYSLAVHNICQFKLFMVVWSTHCLESCFMV
jgi:hypothetical protein